MNDRPRPRTRTTLLSTLLVCTLLIWGATSGGAADPETQDMVYEEEDNGSCRWTLEKGNTVEAGDTHAGEIDWGYSGPFDTVDYWDLGHPGEGVTFHAHFAAGSDKGNNLHILHGTSTHDCSGPAQGADCGDRGVGLSYQFSCTFQSDDHYFLQVSTDTPGSMQYQIEFVRYEGPPPPPCEEGKNAIEQILFCDLPL